MVLTLKSACFQSEIYSAVVAANVTMSEMLESEITFIPPPMFFTIQNCSTECDIFQKRPREGYSGDCFPSPVGNRQGDGQDAAHPLPQRQRVQQGHAR